MGSRTPYIEALERGAIIGIAQHGPDRRGVGYREFGEFG
jgi:hypothetical protein